MGRWLRRALQDPAAMPTAHARNDVYKARTLAARILKISGGDAAIARKLATLGTGEASSLAAIADADRALALDLGLKHAAGVLAFGTLTQVERSLGGPGRAQVTDVPPWPLEQREGPITERSHWSDVGLALAASKLGSEPFAALHGIKPQLARRCAMVLLAARRIADGDVDVARALSETSAYATLELRSSALNGSEQRKAKIEALRARGRRMSQPSPRAIQPQDEGLPMEGAMMDTPGRE